jgi:hypothetical protein
VRPRSNAADDLIDRDASCDEGVCNERAMATPWNGLRAHQHDLLVLSEADTSVETLLNIAVGM